MFTPSIKQLRSALRLQEQIEKLQAELQSLMAGWETGNGKRKGKPRTGRAIAVATPTLGEEISGKPAKKGRKRRRMSEEARARIVAAQKARWARFRKAKASS